MTSDNIFNKNNICILTNTPCKIVYGGINRCTCNICNTIETLKYVKEYVVI